MPIIKDPKMNPQREERYGVIEMSVGTYVVYDKKVNNQETRYLPWGWEIEVQATATSNTSYLKYEGKDIYDVATKYKINGPQGKVVKKIQKFICEDPNNAFHGVQNHVGLPRQAQQPVNAPDKP